MGDGDVRPGVERRKGALELRGALGSGLGKEPRKVVSVSVARDLDIPPGCSRDCPVDELGDDGEEAHSVAVERRGRGVATEHGRQ